VPGLSKSSTIWSTSGHPRQPVVPPPPMPLPLLAQRARGAARATGCLLWLSSRPGPSRSRRNRTRASWWGRAGRWDQAGSMDATLLLLSADCTAAASGRLRPRLPAGPHVASPGPSARPRTSIRASAASAALAVRGLPHHASVAGVSPSPSPFIGSSFLLIFFI
jgi:hypothetical protein